MADCRAALGEDRMHAGIRSRSSWNFRCIVVAGTTSNLAAVPEKRDASRGLRGRRRRRDGGPPPEREWGRTAASRTQYACRTAVVVGTRASRKEDEIDGKLSYFRPAGKTKDARMKSDCPITLSLPRAAKGRGDLSIYFPRYYRPIAIQCSSYARLILRSFYVISIGERRDSRRR